MNMQTYRQLFLCPNITWIAWTDVSSGVPQGPTLFLVSINDMEDGVQSTVLKFADDTNLYIEVTKEEGGEQLQEDLDKCTEWVKQWMTELNVAKEYMQAEETE